MKKIKLLATVFAVILTVFSLVGCSNSAVSEEPVNADADTSLQSVLDKGTLRVGLYPEYPPFESINEKNEIVGFDPSLASSIADKIGVKAKFANTPWESLIAGLNNNDFDMMPLN